ncbi:Uncharacterized protein DAT39_023294, partial [Clarias magur]
MRSIKLESTVCLRSVCAPSALRLRDLSETLRSGRVYTTDSLLDVVVPVRCVPNDLTSSDKKKNLELKTRPDTVCTGEELQGLDQVEEWCVCVCVCGGDVSCVSAWSNDVVCSVRAEVGVTFCVRFVARVLKDVMQGKQEVW